MLEIPLHREGRAALYQQVAEHLRRLIVSGALPPGTRLPGTRVLSGELDVSRTTVVQAYALLEDDGMIRLQGRSGAFVLGKCRDQSFKDDGSKVIDLASGLPSMDLVPVRSVSKTLREVLKSSAEEAFMGSPPEGLEALRRGLVRHAVARGIPASWENLLVTAGLQEGLSILLKTLALSGTRTLWVEPLTYPDAVLMAQSEGLAVESLPGEPAGIPECVSKMGPHDALYLIPSFHNPLGRTLSLGLRQAILEETARSGSRIIEDDAYGELRYGETSVPALRSLPEAGRVIYMGSFSQVLFPGLRFGYLLLPEDLSERAAEVRKIRTGGASSLVQMLVLGLIESGNLARALDTARMQMSIRMGTLVAALSRELPGCFFCRPEGGIYLWLNTPGLDGERAARASFSEGVKLVPGAAFSVRGEKIEAVRLSISRHGAHDLEMAVCSISSAWREQEWNH